MKEYIYNYKAGPRFLRIFLLLMLIGSSGLLLQIYMENHFQIYEQTLRFHIRAASDEAREQELKLQVRDTVLASLKMEVGWIKDASAMELFLRANKTKIFKEAQKCLDNHGDARNVEVYFTEERFPLRRYGAIIFPAGVYHAMRIDIGPGNGHNWWCALYPELCYNKDEFVLTEKGRQELEASLSELEQKILSGKAVRWGSKVWSALSEAVDDFLE